MSRQRDSKGPFTVRILPAEKPLDTQQVIRILLRGAEYRPIVSVPADGTVGEGSVDAPCPRSFEDGIPPKPRGR